MEKEIYKRIIVYRNYFLLKRPPWPMAENSSALQWSQADVLGWREMGWGFGSMWPLGNISRFSLSLARGRYSVDAWFSRMHWTLSILKEEERGMRLKQWCYIIGRSRKTGLLKSRLKERVRKLNQRERNYWYIAVTKASQPRGTRKYGGALAYPLTLQPQLTVLESLAPILDMSSLNWSKMLGIYIFSPYLWG